MYTQEYVFAERCSFHAFLFEGKFRKYDISVKQKHTKTNENMIFCVLFINFRKTKLFLCSVMLKPKSFHHHCQLKLYYVFNIFFLIIINGGHW